MPSTRLLLSSLLLLPLAGCPDESSTAVTIHGQDADLVAIRLDDEGWRPVTIPASGTVVLPVTGPYEIVRVCDSGTDIDVQAVLASVGDATEWHLACSPGFSWDGNVTIESVGDGPLDVRVGGIASSSGTSLRVEPGRYDVIAFEQDSEGVPRFVIQRDVAIGDATTLRFDLERDGVPLERREVIALGAAGTLGVSSHVQLAGGAATRVELPLPDDLGALVIPAASLRPGDRQTVTVDAVDARGARQQATVDAGAAGALTITLPPLLAAAAIDWAGGPAVTWQSTGEWSMRELTGWQARRNDLAPSWTVRAHPSWVAEAGSDGALAFPDVAAIDGWQARWNLDAAAIRGWRLTLAADDAVDAPQLGWTDTTVPRVSSPSRLPRTIE